MNTLEVTITRQDFAGADQFDSPENCPLTRALIHTFSGVWRCGVFTASNYTEEGLKHYRIPTIWGYRSYTGSISPDKINQMICDAKQGKEVESVVLILEEES